MDCHLESHIEALSGLLESARGKHLGYQSMGRQCDYVSGDEKHALLLILISPSGMVETISYVCGS